MKSTVAVALKDAKVPVDVIDKDYYYSIRGERRRFPKEAKAIQRRKNNTEAY